MSKKNLAWFGVLAIAQTLARNLKSIPPRCRALARVQSLPWVAAGMIGMFFAVLLLLVFSERFQRVEISSSAQGHAFQEQDLLMAGWRPKLLSPAHPCRSAAEGANGKIEISRHQAKACQDWALRTSFFMSAMAPLTGESYARAASQPRWPEGVGAFEAGGSLVQDAQWSLGKILANLPKNSRPMDIADQFIQRWILGICCLLGCAAGVGAWGAILKKRELHFSLRVKIAQTILNACQKLKGGAKKLMVCVAAGAFAWGLGALAFFLVQAWMAPPLHARLVPWAIVDQFCRDSLKFYHQDPCRPQGSEILSERSPSDQIAVLEYDYTRMGIFSWVVYPKRYKTSGSMETSRALDALRNAEDPAHRVAMFDQVVPRQHDPLNALAWRKYLRHLAHEAMTWGWVFGVLSVGALLFVCALAAKFAKAASKSMVGMGHAAVEHLERRGEALAAQAEKKALGAECEWNDVAPRRPKNRL